MKDEAVDQQTVMTSGTVTWNQDGVGVAHAVVYQFRVDHQAKSWWNLAVSIPLHKADSSRRHQLA